MMKLVFIALIGYGVWSYYEQNTITSQVNLAQATQQEIPKGSSYSSAKNLALTFSCDGRQHCSQMSSYKEAVFFINNCPNTKMDGDHDGKPCERQFGH
ncbi:MAG: calcium-binding protein [Gammaproteobacteria bacterium]|nr:MAG: calcium-binding protein [Gammaproteobacteria bacterium]